MMNANYHTHTARCRHASGEDREYVEAAISQGIKVLGFSDHCPWVFPDGFVSGTRMEPHELDGYFKSLCDLRDEYKDDITIYIGFEAEHIPELMPEQDKLLADYPVDYMILGQHFLEPEPFGAYTGYPTPSENMLAWYTDLVIEALETGRYKYAAHPDLLHFTGDNETYRKHYTRLCQCLKRLDIPVEINLLGLGQHRHYPDNRFLEIARDTGCCAILGIDAHCPQMITDNDTIRKGEEVAKKYGLPLVDRLPGLD